MKMVIAAAAFGAAVLLGGCSDDGAKTAGAELPAEPTPSFAWSGPANCGPQGESVGPCSYRARADGGADIVDAQGRVTWTVGKGMP